MNKSRRSYKPSKEDDLILQEIRQRYDYAKTQWDPIIAEGRTDLRFIAGDTWEQKDKTDRKGRLTLTFDQLGQYLNQVVNAWRQNKRAIKVTPVGNGANDETARIRADRIRQIEYESHANEAYIAGFTGSLERSFGYVRVVSEFEGPRSFNKVIRIRSVPNPEQVLPDPDGQSVCGADWKYLFYVFSMSREEFERKWPDAKTGSFSAELHTLAPEWHQEDRILVAEYWSVTLEKKTLLLIGHTEQDAKAYFEEEVEAAAAKGEIPPGSTVHTRRRADVPRVCKYITNGVEILEGEDGKKKYEWPGKYIPFSGCYGKILHMNDGGLSKKIILSFVRLARDAQKYFNWLKSTEGEAIKLPVRSSLWARRGQLSKEEIDAAQDSINNPKVVLFYGSTTEETGGQVLGPPERDQAVAQIQSFEIAAEAARRDIQNALGRYSASVGRADTNVKSGVALKQLDQQSDQGSYHFTDAGDAMVEHVGEIVDDLLQYYDDTAKDITVRDARDVVSTQRVNDPTVEKPIRMDQGDHLVTIGTGPAIDSEREMVAGFADALMANMDQIARVTGPKPAAALLGLTIKLKNLGPLGETMEKIVTPPEFAQEGQPNPAAAAQQLQQMKQQIQHAEQAMQQLNAALEKEKAGNDTKLAIADKDNATKKEIAAADRDQKAADREVKIAVAELTTKVKDLQLFYEERQRLGLRAHEAALAAADAGHEQQMAELAHQHELETQQAGHEQQLAQGVQAAALAPPPAEAGAGA